MFSPSSSFSILYGSRFRLILVTSRMRMSSRRRMSWRRGLRDFLWRVMIMGLEESRAFLTALQKAGLSISILPTSSMTMTSASRMACSMAVTPSPSRMFMSTPKPLTFTLLSVKSTWARMPSSLVSQLMILNPRRLVPSSMDSVTMPPTMTSFSSSFSTILRRVLVLPTLGRPVMPIFSSLTIYQARGRWAVAIYPPKRGRCAPRASGGRRNPLWKSAGWTRMAFENQNSVFRMAQAGKTAELDRAFEEAYDRLRKRAGESLPMLVAGQEVRHPATFDDLDPATGEVIAKFPKGTSGDVEAAVRAAKAAQPAWERLGWEKRAAIIHRAGEIMVRERPHLAALMCLENGKNRVEAYYDVDEAIDFLFYYSDQMRQHKGYVVPLGKPFPDETCVSVLRPWGVFAVVGPFNFPAAIPTGMTTGALVTGNAVVLKPASDTPWTSYEVVRILHEAGVPRDVLSFVTGGGREVGQPLIDHPDVGGLVFTGSREVGMRNYQSFLGKKPR